MPSATSDWFVNLLNALQSLPGELAFKGSLILVVAGLAALALSRKSAAARYSVWMAAMVGLIVLVPLLLLIPKVGVVPDFELPPRQTTNVDGIDRVDSRQPEMKAARTETSTNATRASESSNKSDASSSSATAASATTSQTSGMPKASPNSSVPPAVDFADSTWHQPIANALLWIYSVWLIGAMLCMAALVRSVLRLQRVQRDARPFSHPDATDLSRELASRLRLTRPAMLLTSEQCPIAMTWGLWKPKILLPLAAEQWTTDRLQMVLLHEMAHIRRRDSLSYLISHLACAVHWFNPLAWRVLRAMEVEREQASDDLALSAGFRATDYAEHLVAICAALSGRKFAATAAVAMAGRSNLERRVRAILNDNGNRSTLSRSKHAGIAAAACLVAVATAALGWSMPNEPVVASADSAALQPEPGDGRLDDPGPSEKLQTLAGRVIDSDGKPVAGVDVGHYWILQGAQMQPGPWSLTDGDGRFTARRKEWRDPTVLMAIDSEGKRGGLAVADLSKPEAAVEIKLASLVRVHGGFQCSELNARPKLVHTEVEHLPSETNLVTDYDASDRFSIMLPPGKYRLRGSGEDMQDVYRELTLTADQPDLDLGDMPMELKTVARLYGKPAPEWQANEVRGLQTGAKLADYRGKWVVLHFWGHWCGPCIFDMDQLFMFHDRHQADRDKYEIITVHHNVPKGAKTLAELDEKLKPIIERQWKGRAFPFPILMDTNEETVRRYGIDAFPTTVVINPEGNVVKVPGIWGLEEIFAGKKTAETSAAVLAAAEPAVQPEVAESRLAKNHIKSGRATILDGHTDQVWSVTFLADGRRFATASSGAIRVWEIGQTKSIARLPMSEKGWNWSSYALPQAVASRTEPHRFASYFYRRIDDKLVPFVRVWNADVGFADEKTIDLRPLQPGQMAMSPDGTRWAAYCFNSEIKDSKGNPREQVVVYDLTQNRTERSLDVNRPGESSSSYPSIVFSPDGKLLACSANSGQTISAWNVADGKPVWNIDLPESTRVKSLLFHPDGTMLAMSNWHDRIDLRSTADGQVVKSLTAPAHRAGPLAFSPDGKLLASGDINSPSPVLVWDLNANQVVATLIGHPAGGGVSDLAFSGDGNHLVSVGGRLYETGEVRLWNVRDILNRQ